MAINYNNLNAKYIQAKEIFNSYTINFSNESASGIISQEKIRKINTIAMWMDYIQNALHYRLYDEYSQLDNFLDQIAIELKITSYKTAAEVDLEKSLSRSVQFTNTTNNSILEADMGNLETEGGQTLELESDPDISNQGEVVDEGVSTQNTTSNASMARSTPAAPRSTNSY